MHDLAKANCRIAWHDHIPDPTTVNQLANAQDWAFCSLAEELIVGRYFIDIKEHDFS
jgi:hypothetical protein